MPKLAAGLLLFRKRNNGVEVLLVHPGGPFFKNKDNGSWSIPKGEANAEEKILFEVAKREFCEETGHTIHEADFFDFLGSVKRKDGKCVSVWAFEGDLDPSMIKSNEISIEWPPKSGKMICIPEVDRCQFFSLDLARKKLVLYQVPILDKFEQIYKNLS